MAATEPRNGGIAPVAALAVIIAVGTAARLVLVHRYNNDPFDIRAQAATAHALLHHPGSLYKLQSRGPFGTDTSQWPYPAGYLPILALLKALSHVTHISFRTCAAIPSVIADGAAACLVAGLLRRRRTKTWLVWLAVGLIVLNPLLLLTTGTMGQVDAVWTTMAAFSVVLWERAGPRRWLAAGLCAGLATAVKGPGIFVLLALLPSARTRREAALLLTLTLGLPLLLTAPFVVSDPHAVASAIGSNHGFPGVLGWSLFAQPDLHNAWLYGAHVGVGSAAKTLSDLQLLLTLLAGVAAALVLRKLKAPPLEAAAVVWLVVLAATPNSSMSYLVWAVVPLVLARRYAACILVSILGAFIGVELLFFSPHPVAGWAYMPTAVAVNLTLIASALTLLFRLQQASRRGRGLVTGHADLGIAAA